MPKRYFRISETERQLPAEFIGCKGDKWIHIFYAKVIDIKKGKLLMDAELHGDIVHDMRDCDSLIMDCNVERRPCKYQQLYNQRKIKFWFTNMLDEKINPEDIKFKIYGMYEWS